MKHREQIIKTAPVPISVEVKPFSVAFPPVELPLVPDKDQHPSTRHIIKRLLLCFKNEGDPYTLISVTNLPCNSRRGTDYTQIPTPTLLQRHRSRCLLRETCHFSTAPRNGYQKHTMPFPLLQYLQGFPENETALFGGLNPFRTKFQVLY